MTIEQVDVCVCTFRRASLKLTLESLAAQVMTPGASMRVIIADNDTTDARRAEILATAAHLGLACLYVHAPERNISIARNACLDAAASDWLVFIDDDEVAAPDWFATLLAARAGCDIVFGVSQARYPDPATPAWIVEGDFHSNRIEGNDGAANGYTANVVMNRAFVVQHGLRFAPALGQIGGEDTRFFLEAEIAGARFGYCPAAIVHEDTPAARASLRWLMLRRYRAGQIHHLVMRRRGRPVVAGLLALPKAGLLLAGAALLWPWRLRSVRLLLRGTLHIGHLSAVLGFAAYREYGASAQDGNAGTQKI
jgi:succinoglycan biosynthesis protein ExoM